MTTPALIFHRVVSGLLLCAAGSLCAASGYSEAEFTRLHKEVKILKENATPKDAAVGQQINPVTSVATGADSRAELRFPDKSLTRLGANSRFTLRGDSRTLDLDQGVLLLQVPEQIRGAKVRTAAVTAAVTGGTVMFEYLPGGFVKLIVIEGYIDLFFNSDPSNYRTYGAGEMVIAKFDLQAGDKQNLPDSVEVDLDALLKSSKLLSKDDGNSINQDLVNNAIQQQKQEINQGKLVKTSLSIPGRGTLVTVDNNQRLNLFNNFGIRDSQGPGAAPGAPPGQGNTPPGSQTPGTFQGLAPLIEGKTVLNETSTIRTNPHVTAFNVQRGQVVQDSEGVVYNGLSNGLLQYYTFGNRSVISPALQPKVNERGDWALFRFEDLFINGTPLWNPIFEGLSIASLDEGGGQGIEPLITAITPLTHVILASNNGIRIGGLNQYLPPGNPPENIPPAAGGYQNPPHTTEIDPEAEDTVFDLAASGLDTLMLVSNNGDIIVRGHPDGFAIRGFDQDVILVTTGLGADVRIEGNILLQSGEGSDAATLAVVAGRDARITSASVVADDVSLEAGRDVVINSGSVDAATVNMKAARDVSLISANVMADTVNMEAGQDVKIDGSHVEARGRSLNVKARGMINITNSSVLKAILNSPSTLVRLESQQGNISIEGIEDSDARLESGERIELEAFQGNITLNHVSTSSDVFKAAVGPNGWITIGNSNIITSNNVNSFIELFGGMATGGVDFVADTTLDSPRVSIAGHTVRISGSNTVVRIPKGNLQIGAGTVNHHYNRSDSSPTRPTNGTFQIGGPQ